MTSKILLYRIIIKKGFTKANVSSENFTIEDGISNPESSFVLLILQNKDMVQLYENKIGLHMKQHQPYSFLI